MTNIRETHCCGLGDLEGIQDEAYYSGPEQVIQTILHGDRVAFLTFAQAEFPIADWFEADERADLKRLNRRGTELAAFIRKHKLGQVTASRPSKNPNSGNQLRVWLWRLDFDAIKAYDQRRRSKRAA